MNYNIDQNKIDLIHIHFKSALNIDTCAENVYLCKDDIIRMKKERSRLKAIIREVHESDKPEYVELLNKLNLKLLLCRKRLKNI